MAIGSMLRRRWLPEKSFPSYAYLPGRQPHPVRDPAGHSYNSQAMPLAAEISVDSDTFRWGLDLFNHGYYWEAHEAWEGLWQVADRGAPLRMLFKGLILLSAAGVKIRESKQAAAMRHAGRAATLLRRLMNTADHSFVRALGMSPAALAEHAEAAARTPAALQATSLGQPQVVFEFFLGPSSGGNPISSQERQAPGIDLSLTNECHVPFTWLCFHGARNFVMLFSELQKLKMTRLDVGSGALQPTITEPVAY